jgi:hypothetical protein
MRAWHSGQRGRTVWRGDSLLVICASRIAHTLRHRKLARTGAARSWPHHNPKRQAGMFTCVLTVLAEICHSRIQNRPLIRMAFPASAPARILAGSLVPWLSRTVLGSYRKPHSQNHIARRRVEFGPLVNRAAWACDLGSGHPNYAFEPALVPERFSEFGIMKGVSGVSLEFSRVFAAGACFFCMP